MQRDAGAGMYRRGALAVLDPGQAPDRVDGEGDAVGDAAGLDHSLAPTAVEGEWHGEQRLQGIALSATRRPHVSLAAGGLGAVVEQTGDGLGSNAGAVVGNGDRALRHCDVDLRCDARFFAGIERVVRQLLRYHRWPIVRPEADQLGKLLGAAEFQEAGGGEDGGGGHGVPPALAVLLRSLMIDITRHHSCVA
jgi:hypothetical protein